MKKRIFESYKSRGLATNFVKKFRKVSMKYY